MHLRLKSVVASLVTTGIVAGMLGFIVPVAQAATPPFEPDPNTRGAVTFYDAAGNVVTGGNISDSPMTAYAQASARGRTSDNTATLFGYAAQPGVNTLAWTHGEQMSAGNTFPVTGAPANIASSPNPTVAGAPGELSLAQLQTDFPSTDPTTPGVYQIRIVTSGVGGADTQYFRADIQITGSTWTQIFPVAVQNTTTTLSVAPPSPQPSGTNVSMTAAVSPSSAVGSVQFKDGGANLGPAVSVTAGTASMSTTALAVGSHNLSAVFAPTDPTAFTTSTSNTVPYAITAGVPPFEPDPNTRGCVTFYDASGNVVTGGNISDSPMTAYAQAANQGRPADNTATLFGFAAQPGVNTLAWTHGEQMSAGNAYPVTGAPANIAGSPNPTVAGAPGELSLAQLQTDFPSTDPATPGVYQIRIVTSGVGGADTQYFRADIKITGSTWTQIWCGSTTTALTVSPPSPQTAGTTVNLTATVTPSTVTGTVQFKDGSTNIGAPVPVVGGVATTSTNTLAVGSHNLYAFFSPGDTAGTAPSASNVVPYTITAPPSADLSITKTAPTTATVSSPLAYTIVAKNNGPAAATGVTVTDTLPAGVTFVSATSSQGTCTNASGTVTCTVGNLASGASATITINVTTPA
ncbi:MAG: hypothetical protein QOF07_2759, partial [Bradyrhizobium sp.]|nr:hypothetical protein [Bradyrhizobium sp.]